ncbi:hypothetical protein L1987_17612 [Smallanthus sonchifolius]|uniref:Uncharacterized protein n=1 Tax=Smallanthus sonchifolius TaxID=185202 RepID=A0ACB9IYA0_9ASTR|nr:hypothetical protein L1987_17612 [Smallanthus sonchifolius]
MFSMNTPAANARRNILHKTVIYKNPIRPVRAKLFVLVNILHFIFKSQLRTNRLGAYPDLRLGKQASVYEPPTQSSHILCVLNTQERFITDLFQNHKF